MAFQFHNMMSCEGFDAAFLGGCSMAWIGLVIAVFVIMVARKYIFELLLSQDMGTTEFAVAIAATIIVYFLVIGFTGAYKWATLAGIIAGLTAGYFAMTMMGGSSGGGGGGGEF